MLRRVDRIAPKLSGLDFAEIVEMTLRVRYAETDQMKRVHHANYLIWFESARSTFCRARGVDYAQIERDGLALPVLELNIRYLSPAYYDEEITVQTWVQECRRSLLRMAYRVRRGDEILAHGATVQMLIDLTSGKPRRFPPDLAARFEVNALGGE